MRWVLGLPFVAAAGMAAASTLAPVTTRCPVGGKRFTYIGYASYSTWGALPDGQPVGSAPFPIPIPSCPDNGLVLYDTFDAATAKRLAPIVRGEEYQRLRRTETSYYLAYWLRTQLGETGPAPLWTLLAATWEAKNADDPTRATRYAETFIAKVAALPEDPASIELVALRARAANALRELGRFADAERARSSIVVSDAAGGDARNREGWRQYLAALAPVIARGDADRAPLDLVGAREAAFRCLDAERPGAAPLSAFAIGYCARPEIKARVDEVRKARGG